MANRIRDRKRGVDRLLFDLRAPTAEIQFSRYESIQVLTFNRRSSLGSKRTPTDFGLFQLTTARTLTRGSVISAKDTSTFAPVEKSSTVFSDMPPELSSMLVAVVRRPSPMSDTSVITGMRT